MFLIGFLGRHGIISGFSPRMATQNPFDREVISVKNTVGLNRFDRVLRTGRGEAATRGRKR